MIEDFAWLGTLTAWLSPNYPTGAYAYSHGLEWMVETGAVRDRESTQSFVATAIEQGGGLVDLVLLAAAWRAGDLTQARTLANIARAFRASAEFSLETTQQGAAFAIVTRLAWRGSLLDDLSEEECRALPYPVALGLACASRTPLPPTLQIFAQAFAANLISAAVRLVPLGQTDGQLALAALIPVCRRAASIAIETSLDDIGSAAPMIEIASMRHETQYSRLFRS